MYLNFSYFRGRTSAGGGEQALVQKRGQVSDGGIGKIFAGWGDPPSPPRKKRKPALERHFLAKIMFFKENFIVNTFQFPCMTLQMKDNDRPFNLTQDMQL